MNVKVSLFIQVKNPLNLQRSPNTFIYSSILCMWSTIRYHFIYSENTWRYCIARSFFFFFWNWQRKPTTTNNYGGKKSKQICWLTFLSRNVCVAFISTRLSHRCMRRASIYALNRHANERCQLFTLVVECCNEYETILITLHMQPNNSWS